MRNLILISFLLLLIGASSCKTQTVYSEADIDTPCICDSSQESTQTICFSAVGESIDQMYSKQKALSDAKAGLASLIQTRIRLMSNKFQDSKEKNKTEELEEKRQEATRQIVDQSLSNIRITCEKVRKTKEGNYKTYIRIEVKNEIIERLTNETSSFKNI
ncbi:LPP20 lipoprotein [Dysgonomonas alginatilytica]|uniref:LPP20 lipoprotein n=1 Tax=Dysgonomonas alginatilytica TaxID=1605892 RepID=A0A2V3PIN2_9BACT|nr:LPP20 family lipoprotein [Dysgonomonas alginatilytica]PXV58813.1 LPP20 lipoprotein [Dysgonomonas alginatilytica]